MSDDLTEAHEGDPPLEEIRAKARVLNHLHRAKQSSASQIVTQPEIQAAIAELQLPLGVGNPANFLKDIVRRKTANAQWPDELKQQRVTARQRFGQKRVLEFVPYLEGFDEPFPDRFEPRVDTPVYDVQSISLHSAARRLGRNDETWLSQVMVNLRIVESQLAFESVEFAGRLRDVVHLQTGMKTKAEIDATFIVTAAPAKPTDSSDEEHVFVTCEVKTKDERLLEDQIRFQVHEGFKSTSQLEDPVVEGVKPMAIRLVDRSGGGTKERLIYVVEFETVRRTDFTARWAPAPGVRQAGSKRRDPDDDTPVYDIPLMRVSDAFFRVKPEVRGVSLSKRSRTRREGG